MSNSYDDTNRRGNSNFHNQDSEKRGDPQVRARANRNLVQDFNLKNEYADQIAQMSEEGQKDIQQTIAKGMDKLESDERKRRGSRRFREIAEENRRFREVLNHPDLKLGNIPFHGQAEIEHIEEMAKASVTRTEQNFRETTKDDIRYSIAREIAADAEHQRQGPSQEFNQEQEPEH